eukprot:c6852_g1_i1 orf=61-243(+)
MVVSVLVDMKLLKSPATAQESSSTGAAMILDDFAAWGLSKGIPDMELPWLLNQCQSFGGP